MTPTTASVVALARQWSNGDRDAGSDLVKAHDEWIRGVAKWKTMPWEDHDDIAQIMRQAFVDAAVSVRDDRGDAETRAFLRTAMRRAVQDSRRRAPEEEEIGVGVSFDESDSPEDQEWLASNESVSLAEARVSLWMIARRARATAEEMGLLVRREGFGMSDEEHADTLHVDATTVARNATRAMERIRAALGVAEVYVKPKPTAEGNERRICEYIERHGPSTGRVIRDALGMGEHPFWVATTRLREVGVLVADGAKIKTYRFAGDGKSGEAVQAA